jgi:FdhD protein
VTPAPEPDQAAAGAAERQLEDGSSDVLIREEPLVIEVAGQRVLTMRTPGDDENLATGFLLSEGVLQAASAVQDTRFLRGDPAELRADTLVVAVDLAQARIEGRLTRTHEIRSSCGICGLADPDELLEDLPPLLPGTPPVSLARIEALRARFVAAQRLFDRTGACHGAEIFGPDDRSWGRGEDVGRHNALDKAIGAAARAGHELAHGTAMLSGRAGFDLVLKCLRVRIPAILSVSAASAMSFDLCKAAGATLVGFVRPGRMKVYWSGGRWSG